MRKSKVVVQLKKSKKAAKKVKTVTKSFGPNKNSFGHLINCPEKGCRAKARGPRFRYRCEKHALPGIGFGKVTELAAKKKIESKRPLRKAA